MPRFRAVLHTSVAIVLLALTACAQLPPHRGVPDVHQLLAARSGQQLGAPEADKQTLLNDLLSNELSVEQAVHVALLNNPRVRGEYARLGLAAADVYDAGRLSNPRLSVESLASNVSGQADQLGFGLAHSFTDLLLLPARGRLAAGEFERVKEQAGHALLHLAAEVEIAYCNLVGLQQVATLRRAVASTASSAAELAQRFVDAGNLTARMLAQQSADAASARAEALLADDDVLVARSVLNELLGLAPHTGTWSTVLELPAPPDHDDEPATLVTLAFNSRLDLAAQRREVSLLTDTLRTARQFRYLGAVEVGVLTERQTDRARLTGPTLSLELPVFNHGAGKSARAQAALEAAQSAQTSLELAISNQVHLQLQRAATARARAEQLRSQLIPAREAVVKHTQQEVNYMLEGPFVLLADKQQAFAAYQSYIEAVRDYWLARAELRRAVGARLPALSTSATPVSTNSPDTARAHAQHGSAQPQPGPLTIDHAQHSGGTR